MQTKMQRTILTIDDNDINRLNLKLMLKNNYRILEAGDPEEAEQNFAEHRVDLVVLDLALPPEPDNPEIGLHYLKRLKQDNPDLPVVVITGHEGHQLAEQARDLGALDFFIKPFRPDEVRSTIDRAMQQVWQKLREQELQKHVKQHVETRLLGESVIMRALRALISQVAPTPSSVLICGETGVGKELVARCLHAQSARVDGPFIAVNCASMQAEFLAVELFGHEKSAFIGVSKRKRGWFERAMGGTLYLDELSALPLALQGKLLRVLENGSFTRLGGTSVLQTDVRLLYSSRQSLEDMVADGSFMEALYYRINVVRIDVPPLRKHSEDIELLSQHILARKSLLCNRQVNGFTTVIIDEFIHYNWPGNVRELENIIERAVVLSHGDSITNIAALSEPKQLKKQDCNEQDLLDQWFGKLPDDGVQADVLLADVEKRLLLLALQRNDGVKTKAGRWLGFGDRAKDKMRYICDKYHVNSDSS
ncbi:MAG: sigma-54 dependent transcriptional regulator [Mariprofundales bacterium]